MQTKRNQSDFGKSIRDQLDQINQIKHNNRHFNVFTSFYFIFAILKNTQLLLSIKNSLLKDKKKFKSFFSFSL